MSDLRQLLAGLAGLDGIARPDDTATSPRLVAVGWATVDIERTLADLPGVDAVPAAQDELLGARAWRTTSGPVTTVLLEPTTEGRLAAALARRGEGIAALYLWSDEPMVGVRDGTLRPTALGVPGRLLAQPHPWGPFVVELSSSAPDGASSPGRGGHRP